MSTFPLQRGEYATRFTGLGLVVFLALIPVADAQAIGIDWYRIDTAASFEGSFNQEIADYFVAYYGGPEKCYVNVGYAMSDPAAFATFWYNAGVRNFGAGNENIQGGVSAATYAAWYQSLRAALPSDAALWACDDESQFCLEAYNAGLKRVPYSKHGYAEAPADTPLAIRQLSQQMQCDVIHGEGNDNTTKTYASSAAYFQALKTALAANPDLAACYYSGPDAQHLLAPPSNGDYGLWGNAGLPDGYVSIGGVNIEQWTTRTAALTNPGGGNGIAELEGVSLP